MILLGPLHQGEPIHHGHAEVRHDDIKSLALQKYFRLLAVGCLGDVEIALFPERPGHIGAQDAIVIHDQNAGPLPGRVMTFLCHKKPFNCSLWPKK